MNVEIVHYLMNRLDFRVCQGQGDGSLSELKARSIRCGEREMTTHFRFYGAEDIGYAAALAFVISSCRSLC